MGKIEPLRYDSPTKATIEGYEALMGKGNSQDNRKRPGSMGNYRDDLENNRKETRKQLERLHKR